MRVSLPHIGCRLLISLVICFSLSVRAGADPIHDAANSGDVGAVERLLSEDGTRVNARTPAGAPPLLGAAIHGQLAVVRILVDKGADVNLPQGDGWAPLHAAVCDGNDAAHVEITRLLLAHGAKLDIRRQDGWTPLHACALKGNTATMQVLLEQGASLEVRDNSGSTPLHLASEQGQGTAVALLLEKGADREAKDNTGKTPLQRGMATNKLEGVEPLLRTVPIDKHFDHTPLATALQELGATAGIAFTPDTSLRGTVTQDLKAVPLTVALHTLLHSAEGGPLLYELREGTFHIRSATLLANGSLEQNDGKQATGFDLNGPGVALASDTAHSGRYSVRVTCDGVHDSLFHTANFPLPGAHDRPRRILVHAWVKARNLQIFHQGGWSAGHAAVWAIDAGGQRIKTLNPNGWDNVGLGEFAGYFCGTFDWREVRGNFVVPAGATALTLEAGISWAKGTAWFDDFSVEEAPLVWEPKENPEARIVIDAGHKRGGPIEGVGWNWSYIWDQPYEMNASPDLVDQLLHFAEWDQQSFVRFGFLAQRCLKSDLRSASAPVYDPTKSGSIFYERLLDGFQRLGVNVLACNWQYGDGTGPYEKPPYPADRFADGVSTVLYRWLVNKRYSHVRWISLWNEPDWWYKFGGNYRGDFPLYWGALDDRLRALKLRPNIGIVAADTTQGGSIAADAFPALESRVTADAFSAHDYFSAVEAPGRESSGGVMQPFLRGYESTVTGLNGKAVFIGEFGCNRTDGDASYRGTLGGAELVIGGLNAGVRGFARWAYNHADSGKDDGFNPFTLVNGKLQPKPSVYYGYAVLTKAIKAGMQVAVTDIQGGKDSDNTQRIHAATLTNAAGDFTLLLVNDGGQPKTLHLTGSPRPRLYQYGYDITLPDGLQRGPEIAPGETTVTLKPYSINALTSWQWDRLKP